MSLKWIGDPFATFEIGLPFISEIFNPYIKAGFPIHRSSFVCIASTWANHVTAIYSPLSLGSKSMKGN